MKPLAFRAERKFRMAFDRALKTPHKVCATDSALRLALDKGSVRKFDEDGRMHVEIANISKANICPYKGEEIPDWQTLGLDPEKIYQMYRDPRELEAGASTFNGIQLLKKHLPVDAEDHQMWDIVGTTGTEAKFDGNYLTNSLHIWTKEGIKLVESRKQCELSCGYHYDPDMTEGSFGGKRYDGVMRNIRGNHVALVEEGRAGPDVIVGDSALKTRDRAMKKPTRLEAFFLTTTARAVNPMLAMDATVDYSPLFKGIGIKNYKARVPKIIDGLGKLLKGKTIAKDASLEHVAEFLNKFEHSPKAEKSWDESVSEPQHKAMEAAAHGKSTLGIPKDVGEEFAEADKGKKFGDSFREWAKDKGFSEEDFEAVDKMHADCMDEDPEESMDEDMDDEESEDGVIEEGAEEAADADPEEVEEGSESEEDRDEQRRDAKDRRGGARDRGARDRRGARDKGGKGGAMDQQRKRPITQDDMNKAINAAVATVKKGATEAAEARQFVRPFVGELPLALDSAEKILRTAAEAMEIEDAKTVHPSALRQLIKMAGQNRTLAHDAASATLANGGFAFDGAGGDTEDSGSFNTMFGADRIKSM